MPAAPGPIRTLPIRSAPGQTQPDLPYLAGPFLSEPRHTLPNVLISGSAAAE